MSQAVQALEQAKASQKRHEEVDMAKIETYLGFAARARKLYTGYNTCEMMMERRKIKLLVLAGDLSEGSRDKMQGLAGQHKVESVIYGTIDELSHATGTENKGIFGVGDENLAKAILTEIAKMNEAEGNGNADA